MCGIAGCFNADPSPIQSMLDGMQHRGPDDQGMYISDDGRTALGNVRLSIIDLAGGHQPVWNEDGSVVTVFNGEIYNHQELRKDLASRGHAFRTRCDTEVIVHLYEEHGDQFVDRLNGCFAIAVHDKKRNRLVLCRDRLGIRPLYYSFIDKGCYFASELTGFLKIPVFSPGLNPKAVERYLTMRHVWGNESILEGVSRLPPGHRLSIDGRQNRLSQYWSLPARHGDPAGLDSGDVIQQADELLKDSVRLRLQADVPVGLYLSGGTDSGLIASLAAGEVSSPLECFTVGNGVASSEVAQARDMASRLGANHQVVDLPRDYYLNLPRVINYLDEPIGDLIILPTFCLSEQARKQVKVILTGEGADELFGGYVHHYIINILCKTLGRLPLPLRSGLGKLLGMMPLPLANLVFPYRGEVTRADLNRLKSAASLNLASYSRLVELFDPELRRRLLGTGVGPDPFNDDQTRTGDLVERIIRHDMLNWLPDYTLHKQDRLTMANSVEGRVPFLDHRLVELVSGLPLNFKIRSNERKWLLRRIAGKNVAQDIAKRPKEAFYLSPSYFGDGFKSFVRDWLSPAFLGNWGLLDPKLCAGIIEAGLKGGLMAEKRLMAILILAIWEQVHLR